MRFCASRAQILVETVKCNDIRANLRSRHTRCQNEQGWAARTHSLP